jgi:hypothetical protein
MLMPRLPHVALLPLLLPLVSACGPARNEFAPPCPIPVLVRDLSDLTRYREGATGRDITDVALQGRIESINGACQPGDKASELTTVVTVSATFVRGPAMAGRSAQAPIFIAVTDGGEVVDKQVYAVQMNFPPNVDRVPVTSPEITLTLPISPAKSGAAYGVIAGFQLTPAELSANRGQPAR